MPCSGGNLPRSLVLALGARLCWGGEILERPLLPFALLAEVPVLSLMRVANRFLVISSLALAVLVGLGWTALRVRSDAKFLLLASLILIEYLWLPYPLQQVEVSPFYRRDGGFLATGRHVGYSVLSKRQDCHEHGRANRARAEDRGRLPLHLAAGGTRGDPEGPGSLAARGSRSEVLGDAGSRALAGARIRYGDPAQGPAPGGMGSARRRCSRPATCSGARSSSITRRSRTRSSMRSARRSRSPAERPSSKTTRSSSSIWIERIQRWATPR